jgi:glycosyltransferase involved in cell wall biosynthesis
MREKNIKITLGVVVPCYNEEEVLPETLKRLTKLLANLVSSGRISEVSRIWFVDDGSRDRTWQLIESFSRDGLPVRGIKLSRNRGHQNALLAGLFTAEGDALVSIDVDLQDDINAIKSMVDHFRAGAEIVLGVRNSRPTDSFFKKYSAEAYYHLLSWCNVDLVFNHADYRLLGRRALDTLKEYSEVNLFLRGLVPQLGFRTEIVEYSRAERFAGESKYPITKMLEFAWDGITSFSTTPLRWITWLGFSVTSVAFALGLWALWAALIYNTALPGWMSTVLPVYFMGGVQLVATGVIGEYVAKTYMETKHRPRYVIDKTI